MANLDLGTLVVNVKANGAEQTKKQLDDVNKTVKDTEKTTSKTSKGFKGFGESIKNSLSGCNIFGKSLGDITKGLGTAEGASALLGGAVGALTVKFVDLAVKGIQIALQALLNFAKESVGFASDLEEVTNVVDTTFGENNSIAKWAENCSNAFNLTKLEAENFAGTMGAVLTPTKLGRDDIEYMSKVLTQLSGDLGSFWNTSSEEAFNALRSAITGEIEPMKKYGIVMTQANLEQSEYVLNLGKTWKELTEAEKATARYNYILENTVTAQGDALKTQNSYANATKQMEIATTNASEALGKGMLGSLGNLKATFAEMTGDAKPALEFIGHTLGFIFDIIGLIINIVKSAVKPFADIFNFVIEGLNEDFKLINKGLEWLNGRFLGFGKDANDSLAVAYEKMGETAEKGVDDIYKENQKGCDEVLDSILDLTDTSYTKFEDMYNDIQGLTGSHYDNLKSQADQYNSEYKTIDDALTQYVRDGVREKEKEWDKLNEKNANKGSKEMYLAKAKYLAQEEKRLNKEVEKDREDNNTKFLGLMRSSWEQQNKIIVKNIGERKAEYERDYKEFKRNEEAKTKVATEEERKRSKLGTEKGRTLYSRWLGDSVPKHATGTLYSKGGLALVGEHGAELVRLASGDRVYTNTETNNIFNTSNTGAVESLLTGIANRLAKLEQMQEQKRFTDLAYANL